MPYQAEISRENPACILFVIDRSGSMDEITEAGRSKAGFVADVLNKTLYTLVTTCSKADGVRNYFDVGVIAYGGSEVASGFAGALSEAIVHPINAISEHTLRIEERQKKVDDGAGGVIAYGGSEVTTGFGGALSDAIVHPIQAISEHTLRIEERKKKVDDGAGGIVELKTKFPIWFDPKSIGGTPMRAALDKTM